MKLDLAKERVAALRARISWPVAVVVLVTLALLAFAGQRALAWQEQRQRVADEKAAVAAATAEVEGLIDISATTSEEDMDALLAGATAEFRSELESQADGLQEALKKNRVTAIGDVVSAGMVKLEDGRATVIVAAAGTVENSGTNAAEPRNYRLRVDLQKDGDRWLVSGLEFVV